MTQFYLTYVRTNNPGLPAKAINSTDIVISDSVSRILSSMTGIQLDQYQSYIADEAFINIDKINLDDFRSRAATIGLYKYDFDQMIQAIKEMGTKARSMNARIVCHTIVDYTRMGGFY